MNRWRGLIKFIASKDSEANKVRQRRGGECVLTSKLLNWLVSFQHVQFSSVNLFYSRCLQEKLMPVVSSPHSLQLGLLLSRGHSLKITFECQTVDSQNAILIQLKFFFVLFFYMTFWAGAGNPSFNDFNDFVLFFKMEPILSK